MNDSVRTCLFVCGSEYDDDTDLRDFNRKFGIIIVLNWNMFMASGSIDFFRG